MRDWECLKLVAYPANYTCDGAKEFLVVCYTGNDTQIYSQVFKSKTAAMHQITGNAG